MRCHICSADPAPPWCGDRPVPCSRCGEDHATKESLCSHCWLMAKMDEYKCGCGRLVGDGPKVTKLGAAYACDCGPLLRGTA